ncbi:MULTISPECIES: hypothetical protein [unclassified Microbacterium]|uniref:hypothetical protein n=1 Tax=unclassified Microbacterium TaxID=2609290 RepID=UPI003015C784
MRVYATAADYYAFIGTTQPTIPDPGNPGHTIPLPEEDMNARLRRASGQVESYVRTARYATDPDGYPTDPAIADALRDATCAQADYWAETDDPTGGGAVAGPVKIGSVSLGGTAVGGASSRSAADTRRADEAVIILRNAGLIASATKHT